MQAFRVYAKKMPSRAMLGALEAATDLTLIHRKNRDMELQAGDLAKHTLPLTSVSNP